MNKSQHRVLKKNQNTLLLGPTIELDKQSIRKASSFIALNDLVEITKSENRNTIKVLKRKNCLYRIEQSKKIIVANVDHLFLVVTNYPPFNLLTNANILARAANERINTTIIVNKTDLVQTDHNFIKNVTSLIPCKNSVQSWNPKILRCSLHDEPSLIALKTKISRIHDKSINKETAFVLIGQSGVGKSSIFNYLTNTTQQPTSEISAKYKRGKHTTTSSTSYKYNFNNTSDRAIFLIDTPGIENFGIRDLNIENIRMCFPEWLSLQKHYGACKFTNCRHLEEPGCTVRNIIEKPEVLPVKAREALSKRLNLWEILLAYFNRKRSKRNQNSPK